MDDTAKQVAQIVGPRIRRIRRAQEMSQETLGHLAEVNHHGPDQQDRARRTAAADRHPDQAGGWDRCLALRASGRDRLGARRRQLGRAGWSRSGAAAMSRPPAPGSWPSASATTSAGSAAARASLRRVAARASLHRTEIGKLENTERVPDRHADPAGRRDGRAAGELLDGIYWVPGPKPTRHLHVQLRTESKVAEENYETEPDRRGRRRRARARVTEPARRQSQRARGQNDQKARQGHRGSQGNHPGMPKPQPRKPTHYEPSGSVPGPQLLGRQRRKRRRSLRVPSTAPSGGRLWHGFAVRTAAS